jgi:hypothetical protein
MGENGTGSSKQEPADSTKNEKPKQSRITAELEKFVKTADSLVSTAPLALWALEGAHRGAFKEYTNFVRTKCVNIRKVGNKTFADVPPGLLHDFKIIQRRYDRSSIATKMIGNSSVVSLVSQYDSFLGGLLRAFFQLRPELLNVCERTLTLKELQTFKSIDAARESIVEKEVEAVIRKSHVEQFEWMEKRFDISLRKNLNVWSKFVEVTERRNLLVHCGGIVSSHYLSVCQQSGVDCGAAAVGTELEATRAYLLQAFECLVEIGVKLAHVLWRKLVPSERAEADNILNAFCLDLMNENRNDLARNLLDFATSVLKTWDSEVSRLVFVLNRAQAYKWLDQDSACKKILAHQDWSAVDDKFLLGVTVLKDDIDKAVLLMKKLGNSHDVSKDSYREWPIFKQFRKTPQFMKAYKEIFGEDFVDVPEQNTITFTLDLGELSLTDTPNSSKAAKAN